MKGFSAPPLSFLATLEPLSASKYAEDSVRLGVRMFLGRTTKSRNRRRIAAGVAIVVLLFATSAAVWHHHDSDSQATCQVCHVVHHQPLVASQAQAQLPEPVALNWAGVIRGQSLALDRTTLPASSRAPPSV